MPKRKVLDQHGLNFLTLTVVGWVDVFTRLRYKEILIESLKFCQKEKGLKICAYVIMSNHLHLIAQVEKDGKYTLSEVLRDFKKFTAHEIIKSIKTAPESRREWMLDVFKYHAKYNTNNRVHQFWIQNNHPTILFSPKVIWKKVNYIHQNPVQAGIVEQPEDFVYSSARNYLTGNRGGLLKIDLLEPFVRGVR